MRPEAVNPKPVTPGRTDPSFKSVCPSLRRGLCERRDRKWMKEARGHVAAATLEPQSSVSVAESPRPSICPHALKGTFVPPPGSFRRHTFSLLTGRTRHFSSTLITSDNESRALCFECGEDKTHMEQSFCQSDFIVDEFNHEHTESGVL